MASPKWINPFVIAFITLLATSASVFAQDDEDAQGGSAELNKATEMKMTAQTTRDLDDVADLLETALEKGLDEDSTELAKQLLSSTLFEHAEQLSKRIFSPRGRDRRWRQFRREALVRLERAVELAPKMGDAYQMMAELHFLAAGDRDKANEAIEKAVELAGDDQERLSKALLTRAKLTPDKDSMLADLAQAIKIDPENVSAIRVRGAYYLQMGDYDKAIEDFKLWLETDSENIAAYQEVAKTLARLGKHKEAIEFIDSAIKVDEENAQNFSLRSEYNVRLENYDDAIEDANKALKLDRKQIDARLARGEARLMKDQLDEALEDIEEVLEVEPMRVAGIDLRSRIHMANRDFDLAIDDMKLLADNAPEPGVIFYKFQLGQLYNADDQPRRAIRVYNRTLNMLTSEERGDELRKLIIRGKGDARLSLGQHEEAIAEYEEALKYDEEDDGVLNNLAWVLSTTPEDDLRDGERAIELATKACEVTDYKRPHILSTLASSYAETGDFDKAIEWIEKAIEVNAADAEANKDQDQTPYKEQLESLNDELASYKEKKPWRELQNVEEEKKKEKKKEEENKESDEQESMDSDNNEDDGSDEKTDKDDSDEDENDQKSEEGDGDN